MFRKLVRFVEEEELFYRDEKILVAVSGGVDSVVLFHLLLKMELDCAVLHCNFQLRGLESDGDYEFVKSLAEINQIPFYSKSFDTKAYADTNKISIEMAARELRYEWFYQILEKENYQYIAVGHHADDVAETVFINLVRGTGIHGLTGIKSKLDKVIRPLLPFTRKELVEYAVAEKLRFREDSTNKETDFVRNKIRHQLIPILESINPSIRKTMSENVQRFREVEQIYNDVIEENRLHLVFQRENKLLISIARLQELASPTSHLFEILSPYGFHHRDVRMITKSLDSISGKRFFSSTHQLLRDRKYLILSELQENDTNEYLLEEKSGMIEFPIEMETLLFDRTADFIFPTKPQIACLDASKLRFPLKLRKWQKGDSFKPMGMKGSKKVSDYFIDQKFSLQDKENTWLLISGDKIVWLVGHRLDDRFKITDFTSKILKLELK
ncbi:tRNA lysidine(34) synthetase TilS [Marinifilum sp.]|uniref:tRNA lysidine(34) synthetase TilS n=1 Tax=Marinifilum sp. TaxID=2033137 RepID=UPI003BACA0F3